MSLVLYFFPNVQNIGPIKPK